MSKCLRSETTLHYYLPYKETAKVKIGKCFRCGKKLTFKKDKNGNIIERYPDQFFQEHYRDFLQPENPLYEVEYGLRPDILEPPKKKYKKLKHLPFITITAINHKNQRYDTAGDYAEDDNGWWVTVSKMDDWRYEAMCMMHELLEMILTKAQGVKWKDIDKFDMGEGKDMDDPGSSKKAPYHKQHLAGIKLEKEMCKLLKINFNEYDKAFNKLIYK